MVRMRVDILDELGMAMLCYETKRIGLGGELLGWSG